MTNQYGDEVKGSFVQFDGDEYYKISNVQEMPAFFINLASNSDIWMFLSSSGALTAGRKNSDRAIFPYETDDRIHLSTSTGPKTVVRIVEDNCVALWEPFDKSVVNTNIITRNLYKNIWGNSLVYEEINETLKISFRYKWENSEKFGIIRTACITNLSEAKRAVFVFDGLQNIIPYGIDSSLQENSSCLTDAYKRAELDDKTSMAIYSLSSKIVDMPEPVEVLNANVVWSLSSASKNSKILLSKEQINTFVKSGVLEDEKLSLGKKCAYFMALSFTLSKDQSADWVMVLDVCLNQADIARLRTKLQNTSEPDLLDEMKADVLKCTQQLKAIVAAADGMQCTNDSVASKHHFVNVLYNNMRGGVFDDGYLYDYDEFIKFVKLRNKALLDNQSDFFVSLKEQNDIISLKDAVYKTGNADVIRICLEFLPICFSRRHGDPSRPWNRFFINLKDANGKRLYHYEGNWRDIFQNWESMCLSFPEYIENVIAKFLNASTADGFNPYRINKEGIDWEIPEPHNPFSGLGYWGDHQIVYLTRLLEALNAHNPSAFERLFANDAFSYANVPYHINSYDSILKDSKNTIEFDSELHDKLLELAEKMGSDGKLILKDNGVYYVSFMEKLVVPVLAKLANLVVGGGIWMNTQRPEWNDANNAIVGNGLSMVTVYQLRRHLIFLINLLLKWKSQNVSVSNEVNSFIKGVYGVFSKYSPLLENEVDNKAKKEILDSLGYIFNEYRHSIYKDGFSGKTAVDYDDFIKLFELALQYIDYTIDANREGSIYNAYNVVTIDNDQNTLSVSSLFAMLEGQTTVLGSGKLSPSQAEELIKAMEEGMLYSKEQSSFYLYPLKTLKTFMEKNIIPKAKAESSKLMAELLNSGDSRLIIKDVEGNVRLNENIVQQKILVSVLNELKKEEKYKSLVESEFNSLCEMYDEMFKHREFTGRSGIMYKYEGIGCIYWHQNAKFLLSLEETFLNAYFNNEKEELPKLKETYYRLRNGLGFCKQPKVWGAFPLDPYSHTPYLQGAQQPGMTGQVKEEILTRRLELGIVISDGEIHFTPALLRKTEFLDADTSFTYFDLDKNFTTIQLTKNSLAYTLCQIPIIYQISDENKIVFEMQNENVEIFSLTLSKELSKKVFLRDRNVKRIIVNMKDSEMV